ncbi:procollagen galactosyltransferase [Aureococcus anophagefferens]|uniref:Procollagen galactosyltransferase n=1 Tax=Aureococcus anophagefferens TaxID=44056 RepID=A0ABR1FXA4_AURAN
MAGRVVSVHCIAGGGLEAKTLKLTLPAAWQESPCARLLKAVAKRCEGVDAGDLALETADGARVDAAAPIASTAAERDLFVRAAAASKPAARRRLSARRRGAAAAPGAAPPGPARQRISRSIREAKTIRVALAQRDDDDDVPLLVAHLGSLYVACAYGHDRSYKSLGKIFARFDRHGVDRLDAHGHAPLSHACAHGNPRAASLLLDRGASPDWRSVEGTTLLQLACSGRDAGHVDVACLLLNRGADLAAVTVAGETALHLAAYALLANRSQKTNMVRLLLASGADLEARSRCGVSPADVLARWLVVCRRPGGAPDPADSARRRVVDDADLTRIVCAYLFAGGDDRDGSRVGNLYTLPAAVPEAPRRLVAAEVEVDPTEGA